MTGDDDYRMMEPTHVVDDDYIDDTPKHIRTMFMSLVCHSDCDNCRRKFIVILILMFRCHLTHTGNGTHQDHIHNYMSYYLPVVASEFTYGQRTVVASPTLTNERASFLPENGNTALGSFLRLLQC